MKAKILIADDDRNLSEVLKGILRRLEHRVKICDDAVEAVRLLTEEEWNLLICDARMWQRTRDKADLLQIAVLRNVPVAVTVTYGTQPLAEDALASGAFVSVMKPFRADEVIRATEAGLALSKEMASNAQAEQASALEETSQEEGPERHLGYFIGESPRMNTLYEQISKIASMDLTVLIRGESGTGKELVARAIHENSPRANRPFIAVNCAALSDQLLESELFGYVKGAFTGAFHNKEGLFQAANGGTLFLDEIGSVSVNTQQVLLRVLEDHQVRQVGGTESVTVNTRVVAATNENMEKRIEEEKFRLDLFHRLSVFPVIVPPLRERREDIPLLASYFLHQKECEAVFTPEAMRILCAFDWPGNVRQLENAVLRLIALLPEGAQSIGVELLPDEFKQPPKEPAQPKAVAEPKVDTSLSLKAYLRQCERNYMRQVLENCNGDKEAAARSLGISLATFYRKYDGE